MMQIDNNTSPQQILKQITKLREQKGKEKETLQMIGPSIKNGLDFVINLYWEKALTYQHKIMNEDVKGEKADKNLRSEYLLQMEMAIKNAGYLIVRLDLHHWKHRLYRFLGRLSDYKGDYKRAISYYHKSIKFAKTDPEYLELRYPRWLEVEAFLSYSMIMSGQTTKGHMMAEDIYRKFDSNKDALFLKKNDYTTWAIWKTGIPIRTINALLNKKITFDKNEAVEWLASAEKVLKPEDKFKYRMDEIKATQKILVSILK